MLKNNEMKKVGLSFQKINYIKNLAHFFNENSFKKNTIEKMSDDEISELLIKIKGIGQWTIDMFLIFTLNRLDVMPYSDLAIKKGMKSLFNLNELPAKNEMKSLSINWSPFRTIACMYLWKIVDDGFEWVDMEKIDLKTRFKFCFYSYLLIKVKYSYSKNISLGFDGTLLLRLISIHDGLLIILLKEKQN